LHPHSQDKYIRIFTAPWKGLAILCNDAASGDLAYYDFEMPRSMAGPAYTIAEYQFWLYRPGSSDHDEALRSFPTEAAACAYMFTHDPDVDASAWNTMSDFCRGLH
jgi:hypothetical protein